LSGVPTMWDLFALTPWWLYLPERAFAIWMLVDAYRRGVDYFWFFVIFFLPFIGSLAYFFAIKINDFRFVRSGSVNSSVQGLFAYLTRPSLDELRFRAQQSPTFANHLALAERLMEKQDYAGAVPHLEAALERETEHGQVLYDLSRCKVELGAPAEAVPLLRRVLQKDRHWSNYRAWRLLIDAQTAAGDPSGALATCRELAQLTQSLEHRCLLAEHLLTNGLNEEARKLLDESLAEHQYSSGPARRRNSRWASAAKRLQRQA
jgi:hypothetical protein